MANKHTTLASLFSDTANAIREVTGTSDSIVADTFPDFIRSIRSTLFFSENKVKLAMTHNSSRIPGIAYSSSKGKYYTVGKCTDTSYPKKLYRFFLDDSLSLTDTREANVSSPISSVNNLSCVGVTGSYVYAGFNGNTLDLGEELYLRMTSTTPGTTAKSEVATYEISSSAPGSHYEINTCVLLPSTDTLVFFGNYKGESKSGSMVYVKGNSDPKDGDLGMGRISDDSPAVDSTICGGYPVVIWKSGRISSPVDINDLKGTGWESFKPSDVEGLGIWYVNGKLIACMKRTSSSTYELWSAELSDPSSGFPNTWDKSSVSKPPVDIIYCRDSYVLFYEDGSITFRKDIKGLDTFTSWITFEDSVESSMVHVKIVEVQYINDKIIVTGWYNKDQVSSFVAYYDV